jgi:type VI protein secretion system component VasF
VSEVIAPTPDMIHALQDEHEAHDFHPEVAKPQGRRPMWARVLTWAVVVVAIVAIVVRLGTRFGRR